MAQKSKRVHKKKKDTAQKTHKPKVVSKGAGKKFALFDVGNEKYGINLDEVTEILYTFDIVPVEHLPVSFAGITKLHGKSIPVISMHKLLDEDDVNAPTRTCLLTTVRSSPIGLLVDSDVTIASSRKGKLLPLPDSFTKEETEFLDGIFWLEDSLFGILKPKPMVETLAQWRVKK